MSLQNIADYEGAAKDRLSRSIYDYNASGACDEVTLRANALYYSQIYICPRVLVDVTTVDLSSQLLNRPLSVPILIAPMAAQKMVHPDGEIGITKVAKEFGAVMCLSTISSTQLEDVAKAMAAHEPGKKASGGLWFQLYVLKRRDITERLVRRAEAAGYNALCLTVDAPVSGKREVNARNRFIYPPGVVPENFKELFEEETAKTSVTDMNAFLATLFDSSVNWKDLAWLKSITSLPIILKGHTTR
eukprot:TRINITY_DN16084_c0_g1_i5.p1 TRINITY_DN16084_c0_g1~~TRINITY_DN16084_c0_g1_i5.p1  ORF type:complete len:245 (-),score=40.66 TRINITY_DN16084_c0_g1_i5:499-1233(-)